MPQAKALSPQQLRAAFAHVRGGRYPERDRAMLALAFYAGLRAAEIASLRWFMVTDAEGRVADIVVVSNAIAKRGSGGEIPMAPDLRAALTALHAVRSPAPDEFVVDSERGEHMTAHGVVQFFRRRFRELGFSGASSHSGRRTFITACARKASFVGGSMKDVMALARHRSLAITTAYVVSEEGARRKLVALI